MEHDPLVKVVAELDAIGAIPMLMMQFTGVDDISVEVLWTKHLGDDRYEVRNIPMLARGLAFMDIVRVSEKDDGRKYVDAVVTKSGFRTINLPDSSEALSARRLDEGRYDENWIGATVSTSTNSGAINSGLYNLTSITMVGSSGASLASGGSLGAGGSFTDTWGACGP